jgi:hypothetical protein
MLAPEDWNSSWNNQAFASRLGYNLGSGFRPYINFQISKN